MRGVAELKVAAVALKAPAYLPVGALLEHLPQGRSAHAHNECILSARLSPVLPWEANSREHGFGLGLAGQVESGFEFAIGLLNLGDLVPYFLGHPTCGRAELSRPLDGLFSAFEQLGR